MPSARSNVDRSRARVGAIRVSIATRRSSLGLTLSQEEGAMNTHLNITEKIPQDTGWVIALLLFLFLFFARFVAFLVMIVWGAIENAL